MEIVIVICLLLVIGLLLQDKITIHIKPTKVQKEDKGHGKLPDIIGHSNWQNRQAVPNSAAQRHNSKPELEVNNFEIEISGKDIKGQIPQEEPDEIFDTTDLAKEEDWSRQEWTDGDDGFATGVTFEELGAVGMILREDIQESSLQKKAAEIVQKIQGTELFSLLENSTEEASRRMAELLDRRLSAGMDSRYSSLQDQPNLDGFDIGEFV